jgi:predicted TIM-barrel fold metal-dependent hydrolase
VGDENIMIGTDYGHADTSSEIEALRTLRESGAMDKSSAEKILNDNPRRAYAL